MSKKYSSRLKVYLFNNYPQYDRAGYVGEFSENFNSILSVSPSSFIRGSSFKDTNYEVSRFNFSNTSDGYAYSTDSCVIVLD